MVFWLFGRDSETGLKRRSQRKAKQCIRLWPPTSCHDLGIVLLISGFGTFRMCGGSRPMSPSGLNRPQSAAAEGRLLTRSGSSKILPMQLKVD
jgi:hypothetical protein